MQTCRQILCVQVYVMYLTDMFVKRLSHREVEGMAMELHVKRLPSGQA